MQARINSSKLLNALESASQWASKKSTIESMKGVLINCDNGTLSISATDGISTDITITIKDVTGDNFYICCDADRLLDKVRLLAGASGTIELSVGTMLQIKSGRHKSTLALFDTDTFPYLFRDFDISTGIEFSCEYFTSAISLVSTSPEHNDAFPVLGGIYFNEEDIVSVDGIKMSLMQGSPIFDKPTLIDGDNCRKIAKALSGDVATAMPAGNNRVAIVWGDNIVTTTTMDDRKYPKYRDILPQSFKTIVTVDRKELLLAIKLAQADAIQASNLVVLNIINGILDISSKSGTGSHNSGIECITNGENNSIGMSIRYMLDALSKIKDDLIHININESSDIIVIVGKTDSYRYCIMPLYVK